MKLTSEQIAILSRQRLVSRPGEMTYTPPDDAGDTPDAKAVRDKTQPR